jgi:death-on-curing protein
MPPCRYLDLVDYLLVAEGVLGADAAVIEKMASLHLADSALNAPAAGFGGVEFYPEFHRKAAVLCAHLARNHALPDGNKRVAYLCTVEFAERNGYRWIPPGRDQPDADETVEVMVAVAAGTMDVETLARWIDARLAELP